MDNKIIIIDLDGTLCNMGHRRHLIEKPEIMPKDWDSFFSLIHLDTPNLWCAEIVKRFKPDHRIAIFTGRPDRLRYKTEKWLKDNNIQWDWLMMRDDGDKRDQTIVKGEMLAQLKGEGEILFAIDDLLDVAKFWRENGIICLHCSNSLT